MATTLDSDSHGRGGGFATSRILVGAILLVAAALKGYQLTTEPTAEISLMTSRWFLVLAVEFEVLLGLCLISGIMVRSVWLVTLGCFALFACISLHKALSGEVTCGCFGSVQVNPWYTLCLDLAAVSALLRYRPALWGKEVRKDTRPAPYYGVICGIWLLVAVSAGWGMLRFEANTMDDDGVFLSDGEIVVLEPETWIGKRFPLLAHINQGERLASGSWIVLLYHHDCPQCLETLPRYESLAEVAVDNGEPNVALVEIPPFGPSDNLLRSRAYRARLQDKKDWFVQTPTEIQLTDGTVTAVRGAEELESGDNTAGRANAVVRVDVPMSPVSVVRQVNYEQGAEP